MYGGKLLVVQMWASQPARSALLFCMLSGLSGHRCGAAGQLLLLFPVGPDM
jgi:hypothetical protein